MRMTPGLQVLASALWGALASSNCLLVVHSRYQHSVQSLGVIRIGLLEAPPFAGCNTELHGFVQLNGLANLVARVTILSISRTEFDGVLRSRVSRALPDHLF